jgi:phenylpyruvate tautomerase PptA (4-oxalocrotonate tautomerase family)
MSYVVMLLKQTKQHDFKPELCHIITDAISKGLHCPKNTIQISIQEFDAEHFGTGGILECENETGEEEARCVMFAYLPACTLETKQAIGTEINSRLKEAGYPVQNTRFSFHDLPEGTCSVGGSIM